MPFPSSFRSEAMVILGVRSFGDCVGLSIAFQLSRPHRDGTSREMSRPITHLSEAHTGLLRPGL